ncbi:M15 family metallopeptidase [Streptomyces sp. NPDC059104]|uniref:M15 family metallopeptidase n=1 Tax=Streptomyces sp. NPDC059104 TaxID=3346729 RepID=UPI0036CE8A6E
MADAPGITAAARAHRATLGAALSAAGLVNHPAEWWHRSYGDRYRALATGPPRPPTAPTGRRRAPAGSRPGAAAGPPRVRRCRPTGFRIARTA